MVRSDTASISGNGAYDDGGDSGIGAQVKGYAREATDAVRDFTRYVRTHDVQSMRSDLESRVREHPLATIAIGFGIGFLFGKMVR